MKLCDLAHPFVALASVYCSHALSLSVAENHQGGSNFRFSTNDFDCAGTAALLPPRDRTGLTMLTAMAAIFIVLSIGILIAHALDAFRSR
jgi:hypothetical protein